MGLTAISETKEFEPVSGLVSSIIAGSPILALSIRYNFLYLVPKYTILAGKVEVAIQVISKFGLGSESEKTSQPKSFLI